MRAGLIVVGAILLIAGIWITFGGASIKTTQTDAKIGPIKIQHDEDRAIPEWAGVAGIVVGGLLAVGGFVSKK